MSVPNQANGKKSSNSSIANTPASTPVANSNGNTQAVIHNSPPPNNNAPKYGTLVPNRIFVGGISANTTEGELLQLFSTYGTVKAAKIIQDRAGVSKGYGFITFESEDDAKRPLREADNIVLRERKLNIAPAIKKQPFNFNRAFDGSSPPTVTVGNPTQYFLPPGAMPYFQGSVGYYAPPNATAPGDPNTQQPAVYQPPPVYPAQTGPPQAATYPSMMFPAQTIYMPQQYPMPMPYDYNYYPNNGAPPQYMVGSQGGPGPQGPPLPPSGSPPRPPCYNQQISYATEPVFYNVPMYGGPMDHPPVYSDAVDSAGNIYNEEPFIGQFLSQDMTDMRYPTQGTPPDTTTSTSAIIGDQHHQNITSSSSTIIATTSTSTTNNHPHNYNRFMGFPTETQTGATSTTATTTTDPPDNTRRTNTPVVSLLSFDHIQEKDLNAMQGGRKKKPLPGPTPSVTAPNAYSSIANGYPPASGPFPSISFPPPPPSALGYHHSSMSAQGPFLASGPPSGPFGYGNAPNHHPQAGPPPFDCVPFRYPLKYQQMNGHVRKPLGGNNNGPTRKPFERRNSSNNDYSNRSSVRTDSNSSAASAAGCEENHGNDGAKLIRTNVTTPPPAPYSPLTNHGYSYARFNGMAGGGVTARPNKTYGQYSSQPNHHEYARRGSPSMTPSFKGRIGGSSYYNINNNAPKITTSYAKTETVTSTTVTTPTDISSSSNNNNNNNNIIKGNNNNDKTNYIYDVNNVPQVSQVGASSFAPLPARRSRRSIRRSNVGAGGISEIGAGDAPLPQSAADSVAEACKKLDSLKL